MDDLGRYIVEEWSEEYRAGRMSRREFLRRIALIAGGTAASVRLLDGLGVQASAEELSAASAAPAAPTPGSRIAFAPVVPADDPAVDARMVTIPAGSVPVIAYRVQPAGRPQSPGVLVVHENRGLLDHFKDVARRFAKAGYVAIAPDLASPIGGTARFSDSAEVAAYLGRTPADQHVALLDAGVGYLQGLPAVRRDRIGAIGFCFGGGVVWRLATAVPALTAVAPFYGNNPPIEDVPKIRAAVLAVYGGTDERVDAGIPAIRQAMEKAGIVHEIVVEEGAGHAFFNDTTDRYNARAAQDAWRRVLAWFSRYLSGS